MSRPASAALWILASVFACVGAPKGARADVIAAVQTLRVGGCGGVMPAAAPLQHSALLDRAAQEWATGHPLSAATSGGTYAATAAVFVRGPEQALLERLRRTECRTVMDRGLQELGVFQRGEDRWLVLATPGAPAARASFALPPTATPARATGSLTTPSTIAFATHALALVNEARAHGTRCGGHPFAPAPPLTLSGTLDGVALGHAADMAVHNYFEHQDLSGASPADRVRAVGYREKLVGENIAYGPQTVEEVVQGWLDSPEHCENIMDPRFAEMGIAEAQGRSVRHGLYWVQLLAQPRA
jgi:uncharacterized protein YkwD